jgi:hypothetical protein
MRFPIRFPDSAARPALGIALLSFVGTDAPAIVSLTPKSAVGSSFTLAVQGTGFDRSASVIEVHDGDGRLLTTGTLTQRSRTRLQALAALAGVSPGAYTVTVVNPDGARSNALPLTLTDEVTISPKSGRPGTLFTYTGRGFTGRLDAITHLKGPTAVAFQSKRITTTPQGTFEQQIDSAEFVPGTYTVWAVDDRTQAAAMPATFEIVGATPSGAPPRE